MTGPLGSGPAGRGRRRMDLVILGGMSVFGLAFILTATHLGKQGRARYRLEDRPPPAAAERKAMDLLGTLRVRSPLLVRWYEEGAANPAEVLAVGGAGPRDLALAALYEGRPGDALRWLGEPVSGEDALLQAIALERLEHPDARDAYLRAASLLDSDPDPRYALGRLEFRAGRLRSALEHLTAARDIEENHADLQLMLGRVFSAMEDVGRAKRAFHNVLQLRPGDPVATAEVKRLDGTR